MDLPLPALIRQGHVLLGTMLRLTCPHPIPQHFGGFGQHHYTCAKYVWPAQARAVPLHTCRSKTFGKALEKGILPLLFYFVSIGILTACMCEGVGSERGILWGRAWLLVAV